MVLIIPSLQYDICLQKASLLSYMSWQQVLNYMYLPLEHATKQKKNAQKVNYFEYQVAHMPACWDQSIKFQLNIYFQYEYTLSY